MERHVNPPPPASPHVPNRKENLMVQPFAKSKIQKDNQSLSWYPFNNLSKKVRKGKQQKFYNYVALFFSGIFWNIFEWVKGLSKTTALSRNLFLTFQIVPCLSCLISRIFLPSTSFLRASSIHFGNNMTNTYQIGKSLLFNYLVVEKNRCLLDSIKNQLRRLLRPLI